MANPIRSLNERVRDTKRALQADNQVWASTASLGGEPYLIPLTYSWDGVRFVLATLEQSRTVKNLRQSPRLRLALPSTEDVVLIDGDADFAVDRDRLGREYAATAGWDPIRSGDAYTVFIVTPSRILAWRDEAEITGREVMHNGVWLAEEPESDVVPGE